MSVRTPFRYVALAVAAAFATPLIASAATSGGTLTVTASIAQTCTVANQTLAFTAYNPTIGGAVDAMTNLSVVCTKGATNVYLDLGDGSNAGNCPGGAQRCMLGGTNGDYLNYQLYSDVGLSSIWGAGSPSGSNTGVAFGPFADSITPVSNTLYGEIAAGQDASVDSYSDSVTETVNF